MFRLRPNQFTYDTPRAECGHDLITVIEYSHETPATSGPAHSSSQHGAAVARLGSSRGGRLQPQPPQPGTAEEPPTAPRAQAVWICMAVGRISSRMPSSTLPEDALQLFLRGKADAR